MFTRKNTPTPEARVTVQDGAVAESWGLTPEQWQALTDEARRDYRDRVVYAPNRAAVFS